MANAIINDGECFINSKKYTLNGHPRARYVERFPAKISIGGDEYAHEQFLSNWIINDQTGGIGKEEMDESVDADRCWWTNLICDFPGHMLNPRLATAISSFTDYAPTGQITSTVCTGWGETVLPAVSPSLSGASDYLYIQVSPHWATTVHVEWSIAGGTPSASTLDVLGTTGWTNIYTGTTQTSFHNDINITDQYIQAVRFKITSSAGTCTFTDFKMTRGSISAISGTLGVECNFNSNLYIARGRYLLKLDSNRAGLTAIWYAPANITAIVTSLNSKMYIFCGTSAYTWMDISELFYGSYEIGGNWAIQLDQYLVYLKATGVCAYNGTPDTFGSSWTATGTLSDIPSQIETLLIGKDADGADVLCCATHSWFKVLSVPSTGMANAVWINTGAKLPDHPNGGKGATYWHDGHYISYGLGVKKYVTGSTSSVSEVGLNRDDGLPVEYNGEIVKLLGDSGMEVMFALVDASQVTGTNKSGLYAYTGRGWRCWWADSNNDGAMHDCIVSSAASAYAVYWDCGGSIYYIDIPRGIVNPNKLNTSTMYQSYETGEDGTPAIGGATYYAQTFTPSSSHTVNLVRLALSRVGNPGTLTVSIKAVDGSSHPTGSALCSGSIDGNSLIGGLGGDYEWYDIQLGAGTALTASTKYAIVLSAASGGSTGWDINVVQWTADVTSPSYSGGCMEYSADSGSTWTAKTWDAYFEEWYVVSSQKFALSGVYVSPWFDGGTAAFKKLMKRIKTYSKNVTADETITIKYRFDGAFTDLDNGWSTLDTLNTTGENGEKSNLFGSGQGLLNNSFQYRLDFARGSTNTLCPDLQALVTSYRKLTTGNWYWTLPIVIDGAHGRTPSQQHSDIESAVASETDVTFIFRKDATNETHYVKLSLPASWSQTGDNWGGEYTLEALET